MESPATSGARKLVAKLRWGWMTPVYVSWYFFYLRKRFPVHVPTSRRHIEALASACQFKAICATFELEVYLDRGTLLGACRQNSFAGRPSDLDFVLGGSNLDIDNLRSSLQELSLLKRFRWVAEDRVHFDIQPAPPWWPRKFPSWTRPSPMTIDVKLGLVPSCPRCHRSHEATLYQRRFSIPFDWEHVLQALYGPNWLKADSSQFGASEPEVRGCSTSN